MDRQPELIEPEKPDTVVNLSYARLLNYPQLWPNLWYTQEEIEAARQEFLLWHRN